MELWNSRRHSLRSCPARSLIESTAAERYPLDSENSAIAQSRHVSISNPSIASPIALALTILLFLAVGLAFGWIAWRVAKLMGRVWVVPLWLAVSLIATGLLTLRIRSQQTSLGLSAQQQMSVPVFAWFLPMWALALGLPALVVSRNARRSDASSFDARLARRVLGAYLGGIALFFLLFAVFDLRGVLF